MCKVRRIKLVLYWGVKFTWTEICTGCKLQVHEQFYFLNLFIKPSARSITVSNTTCYCSHTTLFLVFIYIFSLEWFIFSQSLEFMYLMNCFKYLLVSSLLLTGQLPTLSTLFCRVSLSFFSILHWYIRWSTVCMPCLHGHSGLCTRSHLLPC